MAARTDPNFPNVTYYDTPEEMNAALGRKTRRPRINHVSNYYRDNVESLWVGKRTRITPIEARRAALKLYRHVFGKRCPYPVVMVTHGRMRGTDIVTVCRYSYIRGGNLRVNHEDGLSELVHSLSHSFFNRLPQYHGCKSHGGAHADFEASLIRYALSKGWHTGALARKTKEVA